MKVDAKWVATSETSDFRPAGMASEIDEGILLIKLTFPSQVEIYDLGNLDVNDTKEALVLLLELLLVEDLYANDG